MTCNFVMTLDAFRIGAVFTEIGSFFYISEICSPYLECNRSTATARRRLNLRARCQMKSAVKDTPGAAAAPSKVAPRGRGYLELHPGNGGAVITSGYAVTRITSLCDPRRGARLFDSSPVFRATGLQASNQAGSRRSLHYRKLTFAPSGATLQPTPQEGSHGTHS